MQINNRADFDDWCRKAPPGSICTYAVGSLAVITAREGSEEQEFFRFVYKSDLQGQIQFLQRRSLLDGTHYLAVISSCGVPRQREVFSAKEVTKVKGKHRSEKLAA